MANPNLSMFWICSSFILYLLLCFFNKGDALGGGANHYLTVQTSSLLPSSVCNPSTRGPNKRESSLKLVHRHGPCSPQKKANNSSTISQILSQDQTRVSLIQSRIALASKTTNEETDSKVALPGRLGGSLDSSNYIVNVGLGTPKKVLSLIFDTGSDLTWTQCKPCPNCYRQKQIMFDPSGSTTYSNITCNSIQCGLLTQATNVPPECESSTCVYNMIYNDKSSSRGSLAKETLTLTRTDVFPGFLFGCGNHNNGLFGKTAGLLGLGREELSFVSQTAPKYGKYFSYCFPSRSSSTGHLTFGKNGVSNTIKFTPFSNSHGTSYYFLDLTAIYVAGTKLSISPTVYSSGGTVIDSGTVITRLPPATYNMLQVTFRRMMMKYPMAPELDLLDTCYDLSNYTAITVPKISFLFSGGVMVDLHPSGILFGESMSQMCLAFSDTNPFGSAILGNVFQKTLEVVYDVEGGKLGFGTGGCP